MGAPTFPGAGDLGFGNRERNREVVIGGIGGSCVGVVDGGELA